MTVSNFPEKFIATTPFELLELQKQFAFGLDAVLRQLGKPCVPDFPFSRDFLFARFPDQRQIKPPQNLYSGLADSSAPTSSSKLPGDTTASFVKHLQLHSHW